MLRVNGYLNRQAGQNLSVLLLDLARMHLDEIHLDIEECSPVCVRALEDLLEVKFQLAARDVEMTFGRPPRAVSRAFLLMGLRCDGEPLAAPGSQGSGLLNLSQDV
jgi:hypothetical protein